LLLTNDGTGAFSSEIEDAWPNPTGFGKPVNAQDQLVHDLNGDGLDDMLLHVSRDDFSEGFFQALISNGDGTFRDETEARVPRSPVAIASSFDKGQLRDYDGDGHPDLINYITYPSAWPFYVEIMINDGEGYFRSLRTDFINDWLNHTWVALDVDGDGDTDFFEGNTLHRMIEPYGAKLDGTEIDDRLIGGAWDNVYRGMDGDDVLDGGMGDDSLDGGPGNDSLIGGKGDDTYVLHATDLAGDDTINDKAGFDRIEFDGFGIGAVSDAEQDGDGNLVIHFDDGGSLTVEGHFQQGSFGVESLVVGGETLPLSRDPSFSSGAITELTDPIVINAGMNDAWVSTNAPFQGMFITVFPVLKLMFAAWFTFDSEQPPEEAVAVFGAADQRWVTALGSYDGNRAELKAELTTGGSFNGADPTPTQDTDYGTLTIDFSHCNLASVEYDFPSANESGFFTATRVVESNVPLCNELNPIVLQ